MLKFLFTLFVGAIIGVVGFIALANALYYYG